MLAAILVLPDDKLVQVYRYAQTLADAPAFLQATPDEIRAEDALWDSAIAATGDQLDAFVSQAMAEGETTGIDDAGDTLRPAPLRKAI